MLEPIAIAGNGPSRAQGDRSELLCEFEVGKVYRTRGGRRTVEILAIRNELEQPIIGLETESDGSVDLMKYWPDGKFAHDRRQTSLDLVPWTGKSAFDAAERCLSDAIEYLRLAAEASPLLGQLQLSPVAIEIAKQLRVLANVRETTVPDEWDGTDGAGQ